MLKDQLPQLPPHSLSPSLLAEPSLSALAPLLRAWPFSGTFASAEVRPSEDSNAGRRSTRGHPLTKGPWASLTVLLFILFTHSMTGPAETPAQGEGRCRQCRGIFILPDRCCRVSDLVVGQSVYSGCLERQLSTGILPIGPMWQIKSMCAILARLFQRPWLCEGRTTE